MIDNAVRASVDAPAPSARSGFAPGMWFALGHSTIVVLACAGVAAMSAGWRAELAPWRQAGEVAGPIVSSALLMTVALINTLSAATLWRSRRAPAAATLRSPGRLARVLRPFRGRIAAGRAMYPIGLLMASASIPRARSRCSR